jgi:hypothetical protein
VRSLHDEEDRNLEMPFHYTQFGAVLMVDIVGFSQVIMHCCCLPLHPCLQADFLAACLGYAPSTCLSYLPINHPIDPSLQISLVTPEQFDPITYSLAHTDHPHTIPYDSYMCCAPHPHGPASKILIFIVHLPPFGWLPSMFP